jgi:hypothetical protein
MALFGLDRAYVPTPNRNVIALGQDARLSGPGLTWGLAARLTCAELNQRITPRRGNRMIRPLETYPHDLLASISLTRFTIRRRS